MMDVEGIARICHEANRAYCIELGDESQPSWSDAPDWQVNSAIAGVTAHLSSGGMTPEQSHKSWLDVKIREGWVYGPEKDADKKTHPCMMDYMKLPAEQRTKDVLFGAIVSATQEVVL